MKKIGGYIKRVLFAWIIFVLCEVSFAQVTPQIGLNLPNYATPNWNVPLNQNFTILDNYLGGVNPFPNPLQANITGSAVDLAGGVLGSVPYQSAAGQTVLLGPNTTTSQLFLCETGTGVIGAAPTWCNGGGSVTSFAAPSGSWPAWLVPTVTNSTTTPSLAVAASAIPNSALAHAATTVNGQTCTLGSTCTVAAAAGTLTGATLASGVTASSLTSVGTITAGTWQGTPIGNSYLANNYTTVNGQVCTLGGSCSITTGLASNLAGGSLGSIPYQSTTSTTAMLGPNTTAYTYYLCETGTGSVGAAPQWCAQTSPSGTVTSVALTMPSTQFTVTGSPVTSSGTFGITLNSPTGTGAIVLATAPSVSSLTVTTALTATGLVTNSDLANPATTVNGQTCTLGSTCTVTSAATAITVGTTTVGSGTTGYVLYDNGGTLGDILPTGTGSVVLSTSPVFTTGITISGVSSSGVGVLTSNVTAATSSVSQSSNFIEIGGQYWNGSATAGDLWTIQDVIGNGTNGTTTLNFGHTPGSSGTATVQINGGTNVVYRCLTAGAVLPAGSLTITAAACGTSSAVGLEVE